MSGGELFDGWLDLSPAESPRTPPARESKPIPGLADMFRRMAEQAPDRPPQPTFIQPSHHRGRLTYTPQQLKDAALWLATRKQPDDERLSRSAAWTAAAYLQAIDALPGDTGPINAKDEALWLCMRTYLSGHELACAAALVAHAYLQEIGVLPRD